MNYICILIYTVFTCNTLTAMYLKVSYTATTEGRRLKYSMPSMLLLIRHHPVINVITELQDPDNRIVSRCVDLRFPVGRIHRSPDIRDTLKQHQTITAQLLHTGGLDDILLLRKPLRVPSAAYGVWCICLIPISMESYCATIFLPIDFTSYILG